MPIDYTKIFESSPNEIYVFSATTWRFIEVNRGGRDNLGYEMAELSALTPLDLKPEFTRDSFAELVAPLLSGQAERVVFETVHQRKDGSLYPVEVYLHLSQLDGEPVFVAIILDITTRHQMEQALRDSEQRYRQLVENSQNAISLHRPDGTFLYANPAHVRLFGYSEEELLAMTPEQLDVLVHPDDLKRTRDEAHAQARRGEIVTHLEYRARHKDGHDFWVEAFATPIVGANGQVTQILSSIRDIDERKREQARELERALERERMYLLSEFIHATAHEFRTPLAIINTGARLMAQQPDLALRQVKAQQIEGQVQQLSRLVDSLLKMTRLETVGLQSMASVNVVSLLRAVCEGMPWARRTDGPSLYPVLPAYLPPLLGDAHYLADALREVLNNAYHHTPKGGRITVTAGVEDGEVVIDVQDNGSGISPEDLPYVFRTFWRRDKARSTPGLGLGLSIAQRVAELHGGRLEISSEVGRGTRARFRLPILSVRAHVFK